MHPIKLLIRWAKRSDHALHSHVCVIARGGSVLAIASNVGWTHAESAALNKIWLDQRPGARLYSYRIMKDGSLGLAKPCSECMVEIRKSKLRAVYYSTGNGDEMAKLPKEQL